MDRLKERGWDVLDLGAGEGSKGIPLVVFLQNYGPVNYTALDPSTEQLKQLRKKAHWARIRNIRFVNEPWETHQPKEQEYDFIFCLHAFYHFQDWKSSLHKILNAMKRDGNALVTILTPNNISYQINQKLSLELNEPQRWDLHHAYEFEKLLNQEQIDYEWVCTQESFNLSPAKEQTEEGLESIEFIISRPLESLPEVKRTKLLKDILEYPDIVKNEVGYFWIGKESE